MDEDERGKPGRVGDTRVGESLDDLLAQAVAGPAMDRDPRSRLRRRIMELHPGRGMDMSLTTRAGAAKWGRGRWIAPAAAVAVVAVCAGLVLAFYLGPASGPVAEFGRLPGLASGLKPSQGAAGGPGFTFDLDYSLSAPLAAAWPDLPARETVYRLASPGFSEERVKTLADGLGIAAPVVREGFQDGFILAADPGDGAPALRAYSNGYIIFTQVYNFGARPRASLPSADRAVALARDWLVSSGFVSAGELGPGKVTEDLGNGTLLVGFKPAIPADVVSVVPFANAQIGEGGRIAMASATWLPSLATSAYPLRPVAEAWKLVREGKGLLEWATREYPGPAGDGDVVRGPAMVESVRVAWAVTYAPGGTPYLQPVYAFAGRASVPGADGPVSLPFEVWAPAIAEDYVTE